MQKREDLFANERAGAVNTAGYLNTLIRTKHFISSTSSHGSMAVMTIWRILLGRAADAITAKGRTFPAVIQIRE
jgi:hypothetical protein